MSLRLSVGTKILLVYLYLNFNDMKSDKYSNLEVLTEVIIPLFQLIATLGSINYLSLICTLEIYSSPIVFLSSI